MENSAPRIDVLNDLLRRFHLGGRIVISRGIAALGPEKIAAILREVAAFDAFTPDNDPYGERDCATFDFEGDKILWKIDYYDRSVRSLSPNPASPEVTIRVMTVMFAAEY